MNFHPFLSFHHDLFVIITNQPPRPLCKLIESSWFTFQIKTPLVCHWDSFFLPFHFVRTWFPLPGTCLQQRVNKLSGKSINYLSMFLLFHHPQWFEPLFTESVEVSNSLPIRFRDVFNSSSKTHVLVSISHCNEFVFSSLICCLNYLCDMLVKLLFIQ